MKNTRKIFFSLFGLLVFGLVFFGDISSLRAQSSNSEMNGYAWSGISQSNGQPGGAGFIYFKEPGSFTPNWQVTIDSSGNLNGYAWANPHDPLTGTKTFGWVKFGGLTGFPSGSGTVATNARLAGNNIVGWARFCSATLNTLGTNVPGNCSTMTDHPNGGWDGWISFQGNAVSGGNQTGSYGVTVSAPNAQGQRFLSGFAWGGPLNVGWIDMSQVFIQQPPNTGKSIVTFSATTTNGSVLSNQQNPVVTTSTASANNNVILSWYVLDVVANSCMASGDWVPSGGLPNRNSVNGTHNWPPLTFTNATTAPISKTFILTCQGDENGVGTNSAITRIIKVTILPGGNVASVAVNANPKNVPDANGFFLTDINWAGSNIVSGSCVGKTALNSIPLVIPNWSTWGIGGNYPQPSGPNMGPAINLFGGISGLENGVFVPGSVTGDSTDYKLTCTKVAGASGAPCAGDPAGTVCGFDTVSVNENLALTLTAHKDPYVAGAPAINTVNLGEKVSLRWKSTLNKAMRCGVVPLTGATSSPFGLWFGDKTDLDVGNSFTATENGISVTPQTSGYTITCQDVVTGQNVSASTQVTVLGTTGLSLSLIALDENNTDGDFSTVEEGGTVRIEIKNLGGTLDPASCVAKTTINDPNTLFTTSWTGVGSNFAPNKTIPNTTTGNAVENDILYYHLTCNDTLNGLPVSVSDFVRIIKGTLPPANIIHLDLVASDTCLEPGEDFSMGITSISTVPPPVGTDNDFDYCTTTGNGPSSWDNFGGAYLNTLNLVGAAAINIDFSDHNTPVGGSANFSMTCYDFDGVSVSDSVSIPVVADCDVVNPPGGGGGGAGNIKPIIEEQ